MAIAFLHLSLPFLHSLATSWRLVEEVEAEGLAQLPEAVGEEEGEEVLQQQQQQYHRRRVGHLQLLL